MGSLLVDIELLDELLELLFGVDLDALGIQGPGQLWWVLLVIDAGNLCGRESHNLQALRMRHLRVASSQRLFAVLCTYISARDRGSK